MKHLEVIYVAMSVTEAVLLVFILKIIAQCVDGNQRIVLVSDDDLLDSGEDNSSLSCCVYGNCSCNSLDHALAHLTNNVLINITTNVTLSSLLKVSDLQNISVIGYNNPTVNCKNIGGLQFTLCHNCTIRGITWDECGTKINDTYAKPGLKFSYSSNIAIHDCIFQHSIGQAVVLEEVSGYININHCQFVYNSHYRGHGAAVHYSTNNVTNHPQSLLTMSNCNFSYNRDAKSLVYIENRILQHSSNINLHSSKFCHNQGVISIYVINQKLYLSGKILFHNNTAINGTGMYIRDHSTIALHKNSNIEFSENTADYVGGAVFLKNHSVLLFNENSKIQFNYNYATSGTVYSIVNSNVIFTGNCEVTFTSNSALLYGAAIYSSINSHVMFTANSRVTFNNNEIQNIDDQLVSGGIIYSEEHSNISFKGIAILSSYY